FRERCAEIFLFLVELLEPPNLLATSPQARRDVFGERQVVQRMCPLARSSLSLLGQAYQSILAHRFQQDKSWLLTLLIGLVQQAMIEQRANSTQRVNSRASSTATDFLACFEGATANEDSKVPEEPLLRR